MSEWGIQAADQLVLAGTLVIASISDLRTRTVSNRLLGLTFMAHLGFMLLAAILNPVQPHNWPEGVVVPLIQSALILCALVFINALFSRFAHSAMGGGDIKLLALLGSYLSLEHLGYLLGLACVLGILTALIFAKLERHPILSASFGQQTFPWVPAIAVAYVLVAYVVS